MTSFAATWMDLEGIIVREISQAEKDKYWKLHLYEVPRVAKFRETESNTVVARGWGKQSMEWEW